MKGEETLFAEPAVTFLLSPLRLRLRAKWAAFEHIVNGAGEGRERRPPARPERNRPQGAEESDQPSARSASGGLAEQRDPQPGPERKNGWPTG